VSGAPEAGDDRAEAFRRLREMRRRHILEAAQRVFFREGYRGTTMERVAEEAGVSKQTLYNYFADKESLLIALSRYWQERGGLLSLRQAIANLSAATSAETTLREALARTFATMRDKASERDPAAIVRMMMEVAQEHPTLFTRLREALAPERLGGVTDSLEAAIAAGRLRPIDTKVVAAALSDLVIAYSLLQPLLLGEENADLTPERMAAGLTDLLLYGLLPRNLASCSDNA